MRRVFPVINMHSVGAVGWFADCSPDLTPLFCVTTSHLVRDVRALYTCRAVAYCSLSRHLYRVVIRLARRQLAAVEYSQMLLVREHVQVSVEAAGTFAQNPSLARQSPHAALSSLLPSYGRELTNALLSYSPLKVDVRDAMGRTPLMHAARFGSEGCVLRLISHGAARHKKDKNRKTASDLAIAAGHLHIAGIISADPKKLDLMEIAARVGFGLVGCIGLICRFEIGSRLFLKSL